MFHLQKAYAEGFGEINEGRNKSIVARSSCSPGLSPCHVVSLGYLLQLLPKKVERKKLLYDDQMSFIKFLID